MKENLRKTSIICTLGPSSEDILEDMIKTGMNIARINFSHGDAEEQREKVRKFKEARAKLGVSASLILDTQGPEIRIGKFDIEYTNGIKLEKDDEIVLTGDNVLGNPKVLPISYKELYKDVKKDINILIDDGAIILKVVKVENKNIYCIVEEGGIVKERKSINVPGIILKLPALKEKDINDILFGISENFDYIAASFVRNRKDVLAIRKLLDENGGEDIQIIAKIENQEGIDNLDSILEVADAIMVARGDLAVEIPFEEVPFHQKRMIKKANSLGKPVVIATQMLESMTQNIKPTRAEVSDVANAVYDRASTIMLSGETAVGKYPLECIKTMSQIAKNVEKNINYWDRLNLDSEDKKYNTLDEKTSYITVSTAKKVEADAIMAYTYTGKSIKQIAGLGPKCPIFVVTDNIKTYNQLALVWNVIPIYVEKKKTIDEIIEEGISRLIQNDVITKGDTLYITGGKDFLKNATQSKRIGGIAII